MDIELFFEKLFINSELAYQICVDLDISRAEYSRLAKELDDERKCEIKNIKRIRSLYHNKVNLNGFSLKPFNRFYKWYKNQHNIQNGKCYYCNSDEQIIATLLEKKFQYRKRTTRGKHLEVERRDSKDNLYTEENCVLACYFCNNDKSDIFSDEEYLEYLKDRKGFFIKEYRKLND
jgi:hypothetical protein